MQAVRYAPGAAEKLVSEIAAGPAACRCGLTGKTALGIAPRGAIPAQCRWVERSKLKPPPVCGGFYPAGNRRDTIHSE